MPKKSLLLLTAALLALSVLVAPSATSSTARRMSNGCAISARGIPSCGTFVGAALEVNHTPQEMESQVGHTLGVHRTYWSPSQVSSAANSASADLAAGRLPWMSFKVPYSWSAMANGAGDSWARSLATRMAKVNGPVWIAFVHEPEGDGDVQAWRRMQEHLGPILRSNAPNVAFTIILTLWDDLYGPSQYRLNKIWPNTKIDVGGVDIYNYYGSVKNGTMNTKNIDFASRYFQPLNDWVKPRGVPWAIAEIGYTNKMAVDHPTWLGQMYSQVKQYGGLAVSYFNNNAHSIADWRLNTTPRKNQYTKMIAGTPTL
jgi:hypothetical protein